MPEVVSGTDTACVAALDNVAVIVIAEPFSIKVDALAERLTLGALSLSTIVIAVLVPEPALDADPPLTVPILIVAVSLLLPSYVASSVTVKADVPVVFPAVIVISDTAL